MRKVTFLVLFISVVPWLSTFVKAQRFPATTSLQLIPPYSVNLEDYASPGVDRVFVTAVFNDFSQNSWNVKFRVTIQGGGVQLQTNPDAALPPIRLVTGEMEQFTGADLADYFSYSNMRISGIDLGELQTRDGIPEGMYTFSIEVLDYNTGVPISNKASVMTTLILNDPPQITLPVCGARVLDTEPQNILFQWLPLHQGSPNSLFATSYELTIVEMPEGLNPEEAVRSGIPIFQTTTDVNNFLYDTSAPLLENGVTYAYRIRATDSENLGLFKNDGYSNVCWFTFGFSTGGVIELHSPARETIIKSDAKPVFQWSAPNNLSQGQQFRYQYKIVKVEEGQTIEDAVLTSVPFYEEEFAETVSDFAWSFRLQEDLETESQYAWQVTALSGEIEIASSTPALLHSAPKLNSFWAGRHEVNIVSLTNEDFSNLSGKGSIKLQEDGTQYEINFSGLKLKALAGKLFLESGSISQLLPDQFPDIILEPVTAVNGESTFYPQSIHLDRDKLEIAGHVEWPLPFPVQSGELAYVKSGKQRVNFDNLKLNGYIALDSSNQFQLLDPFGFDLHLPSSSNFFLRENSYTQNFDVEMLLPEPVKSDKNGRVMVKMNKVQQLFFNQVEHIEQPIKPVRNLNIQLIPKLVHIDLSSAQSPGEFSASESWMGLYFEKFDLLFPEKVDDQQLTFDESITHSFEIEENIKAWVDAEGLDLKAQRAFTVVEKDYSRFNNFYGKVREVEIDIANSVVQQGEVTGDIHIPLLDSKYFDFNIPISDEGFEEGYLVEELMGQEYTFGNGAEDKVRVKLGQAVFADNERLDLSVALEWPATQLIIEQVHGFKIWGNGQIGFETPNGTTGLSRQVSGELHGYPIVAHSVSAGLAKSSYYFNVLSTIAVDEDLSGENGPVEISMYSAEVADLSEVEVDILEEGKNLVEPNLKLPKKGRLATGEIILEPTYVKLEIEAGTAEGYINLLKDDPDWGDSWQGSLSAEITVPTTFHANVTFISGKKDDFTYWFFEGGLGVEGGEEDTSGTSDSGSAGKKGSRSKRKFKVSQKLSNGLPLGPLLLVGADLRFYKNMSHSDDTAVSEGEDEAELEFLPDPDNSFGIYGRIAGLDLKTQGEAFSFDAAFTYSRTVGGTNRFGFEGNVAIGSTNASGESSLGTGHGKFIYDEAQQFYHGAFNMEVESPGKLCAVGNMSFTMSPDYWQVNLGSEEEKIVVTPGCAGFTAEGFLEVMPDQFSLGLGFGKAIRLKSPEVSILGNDFIGRVDAGFVIGAKAAVRYKPYVSLMHAGVWLDAWAAVSVDYDTWFDEGTWEIASANLRGYATVYFEPSRRITGRVEAEVEVLKYDVEFDMGFNTSF
ncbi:hypothetical protein FNH22_00530 [Fulvivirga sp. M361]|uniref:hypothetical protein n=1 Tax=Fulvivirga sp. M361 TaxID=2594266 RepID=UPI00117B656E|nr:hypothetical protein [Fulvivirga sp. M361]TRX62613.1 hypothetical protein FNH22_00530 [Fulvivirga sp. M361]